MQVNPDHINDKIVLTSQPDSIVHFLKKTLKNKHLIVMFAKREIRVKYAQTLLKNGLIIIQPLLMMLVFTVFFGYILGWKSKDMPFPIYVFSGMIIWNLFQTGISHSLYSLSENAHLIKNTPLPKSIFTLYKLLISSVDMLINTVLLLIVMIAYGILPSYRSILLFIPAILTLVLNISLVWLLQLFSLHKRDILHLVPYFTGILIWATPVFFTPDILPDSIKFILYVNPVASLIELWRYLLIPDYSFKFSYLYSLISIFPLALISIYLYSRADKKFNDYI